MIYNRNHQLTARAELKRVSNKNEFNGVGVTYISKLHGVIDSCDIYFKDVFLDQKRASVNVNLITDE